MDNKNTKKIQKESKEEKENMREREKGKTRKKVNQISENKGITLVALVITIIVIIILSVVAINFTFGENGLIKRAEQAGEFYVNDTKYTDGSITNVESYINDILEGTGGSTGGKTLVHEFNEGIIKVGDYINYTPEAHDPVTVGTSETGYTNSKDMSEGTDQTFSQNENTTWRVLGLSEDGNNLLITSGSPIKKDGNDPYLVSESAAGAANCVEVLNKISGIYHNSTLAEETRSITIEDLEIAIGDMTVEMPTEEGYDGRVYFTADKNKEEIGWTTDYPSYTYEDGDYTLTNPPQKATAGTKVDANSWMFYYTEEDGETRADYIPERVYDNRIK